MQDTEKKYICSICIPTYSRAPLLRRTLESIVSEQSFKDGENQDPSEEMADVLWVLICLANQTGVDLTTEFEKNLQKKTQRDSLRHIGNPKLKA